MKTKHTLLVLTGIALLSSNAFSAKWDAGAKPSRTITYKKVGGMELKLHVFDPPAKAKKPMAAIVFFFGGGWNGGTPSQFHPHCQYLFPQSLLAISAGKRAKKKGGGQPSECVKKGKTAKRYLRQNAKEIGGQTKRIASGGGAG
ncbi:MAG: alpha/beta hydrolase, partial [Planctomycetes bacterium]|nr:alpha/beta hydrolase [Planctomycetota bacterium]